MTPPAASKYGWSFRDRGFVLTKPCDNCGRASYMALKSQEARCDGCGDLMETCVCPETRELV